MKIESDLLYRDISNIEYGECFLYEDGIYVKVNIGSLECPDISKFPNIALKLTTNELNAFKDGIPVRIIPLKVVIG